uniref:NB-ARC domain-containing protein n=1 Tax=Oryza meridionalis TaxID=40149 RepID=A0A0E0CIR3_9ORYZ
MKVIPAACSSFQQLEKLEVDSISAVLVAPICSLLAATLSELSFKFDLRMESFTETQEEALQLLTSLRKLDFGDCPHLRSLPEGLRHLSSLEELAIFNCRLIRSMPEEGLPASLKRAIMV